MSRPKNIMEKLVSLCKTRGFIFPTAEKYGGLQGFWDWGPLGVELKNNIKKMWWQKFVQQKDNVVGLDSAIITNPEVWEKSGHLKNFRDKLVECKKCHRRFKEPEHNILDHSAPPFTCPYCGSEDLEKAKDFNTMFKTFVGPAENSASTAYLRPETAQNIFVNFENVMNSQRLKLPFGIAQIGKAFRNEITPGNFIFRTREFEQMELEYFIHPKEDKKWFDYWVKESKKWFLDLGLKKENLKEHKQSKEELAHYAKETIDLLYNWPFEGFSELIGIANRTDYDLKAHNFKYKEDKEEFIPYVIEPSFGVERPALAFLLDAYEEVEGGRTKTTKSTKNKEVVLRLNKHLAPYKVAVLPLSRKEPLKKLAKEIHHSLRKEFMITYDESASIGRRYRRQDEIGTPYCVTVDFDSLDDKKVTVRDRDTMKQDRIFIKELPDYIKEKLA
ncbi:MAG: glycine--tRNA ligase [Patescibacteria group bacterium]|nr:glycine--tRNA ligase [Patescibacteria group bacterium]